MAVASAVAHARDVNPVDAMVGGLLDELVVVAVVNYSGEPSVEDICVSEALALPVDEVIQGDADVSCFIKGVLRGIDASNFDVELVASVTATD